MKKTLIPFILGGISLFSAGQASAAIAQPFGVNASTVSPVPLLNGGLFTATQMVGTSSGLIRLNSATNTATESGWLRLDSFSNNGPAVNPFVHGLNGAYQLFFEFSLEAALNTGTFGSNGSTYSLTSLTYTLWADSSNSTNFTTASLSGGGTEATFSSVNPLTAIATGSILSGTAAINAGGVALNSVTDFDLTDPAGLNYFVEPDPFHEFAANAFNNTSFAIDADYDFDTGCVGECLIAVVEGGGVVTFVDNNVPEPTSIALLGAGLLGFGSRMRKKA